MSSKRLASVARRLPGLLQAAGPAQLAVLDLQRFVSGPQSREAGAQVAKARNYRSSAAAQQAAAPAEAKPAESSSTEASTEVQYTYPLGAPSAPAFGLGLFALLGAVASEWIYFTDELIEMLGFWALFLTVYRFAAPQVGQMFDETAKSIRASELDKIRAARDALGLEELAKRYAPATAQAEQLVDRELQGLKAMQPQVEKFTRSMRTKELLDMHMEFAAVKDEQMKEFLIKRFKRRVLNACVNKPKK